MRERRKRKRGSEGERQGIGNEEEGKRRKETMIGRGQGRKWTALMHESRERVPLSLPCSLRRSDLLASTSGRSALSTWLRHWLWRLPLVTVKLTKVTLEQRSGGNST